MNVYDVILNLIIFVMFAIALRANISINQVEREKFLVIYVAVGIATLIMFWVFRQKNLAPSVFLANFMIFGSAIPQLIARFMNLRHAKLKKNILKFQANTSETVSEILAIIFLLVFILIFLIPSIVDTAGNRPNYNWPILYAEFGLLVFAISSMVLFSMNILQKAFFYSDGFSHKGLFWRWSDFQAYNWQNHPKKKNAQEILLITAKGVWIKQIKFFVPNDFKEQVDLLLAQKLKKTNKAA